MAEISALNEAAEAAKHGNKVAFRLSAVGVEDAKGKFRMIFGYSGHIAGDPDKPLSTLIAGLIDQISCIARYSDDDAARADIAGLRAYVDSLQVDDRPKTTEAPR